MNESPLIFSPCFCSLFKKNQKNSGLEGCGGRDLEPKNKRKLFKNPAARGEFLLLLRQKYFTVIVPLRPSLCCCCFVLGSTWAVFLVVFPFVLVVVGGETP